jgi:ribosomal protein L13
MKVSLIQMNSINEKPLTSQRPRRLIERAVAEESPEGNLARSRYHRLSVIQRFKVLFDRS